MTIQLRCKAEVIQVDDHDLTIVRKAGLGGLRKSSLNGDYRWPLSETVVTFDFDQSSGMSLTFEHGPDSVTVQPAMSDMTRPEAWDDLAAMCGNVRVSREEAALARIGRELCGLDIDPAAGTIHYRGHGGPLGGATFGVETAGNIEQRHSVTKTALYGTAGLAFTKSKDRRELYLHVEGQDYALAVPVHPDKGEEVRSFSARVSTMARRFDASASSSPSGPSTDLSSQLAQLAELHAAGALNDDEFAMAKARLLDS